MGGVEEEPAPILASADCATRTKGERMSGPQQPQSRLGLDPILLEVLACPADHHAPLELGSPDDPAANALTCTECGRVFPVRDGIPVLLLDEATGGPAVGAI